MSYLRYLCLFAHRGVQHLVCCDYDLSIFDCHFVFSNDYLVQGYLLRFVLFFINVTCIYLRILVSNAISISVDVVVRQEHYVWHGCFSPEHFSSFRDCCGLCRSLFVLLSFFIR
jgi:hypothetical protein